MIKECNRNSFKMFSIKFNKMMILIIKIAVNQRTKQKNQHKKHEISQKIQKIIKGFQSIETIIKNSTIKEEERRDSTEFCLYLYYIFIEHYILYINLNTI